MELVVCDLQRDWQLDASSLCPILADDLIQELTDYHVSKYHSKDIRVDRTCPESLRRLIRMSSGEFEV